MDRIKLMITLGPSTNSDKMLKRIKHKRVDFLRINMSHTNIDDLKSYINLAQSVDIPFILDTEGSQARTGKLIESKIAVKTNDKIKIHLNPIRGDTKNINFTPHAVFNSLREGDLIYIDFKSLVLRVYDTSMRKNNYIICDTIIGGELGENKGVLIQPRISDPLLLPTISKKDKSAINIGLKAGLKYLALSFTRSEDAVREVRLITKNQMKIISKIECLDGLNNLDEIIRCSDMLLIDRGDLSKEIPIDKIPFAQKFIIEKAKRQNTPVYVATNFLESMITNRQPTKAEVHDTIATILDGAEGIILSAETAIGKYPIEAINMINRLSNHALNAFGDGKTSKVTSNKKLTKTSINNYLLNHDSTSTNPAHGGTLINKCLINNQIKSKFMPTIKVDKTVEIEIENIATGVYSPLTGFIGNDDLQSILKSMKLSNGLVWPIPILLDIKEKESSKLNVGDQIGIKNDNDNIFAVLDLKEMFHLDKKNMIELLFKKVDLDHPGIIQINNLNPICLAGDIKLLDSHNNKFDKYRLTPKQLRKCFNELGWSQIAGFHTRNIPHKGHEQLIKSVIENGICDGILIQPVIGKKKTGDLKTNHILKCYEILKTFDYFRNKILLTGFPTYSRYAGPREAIFTALTRKNYGCTHFIVGRDHTGVGNNKELNSSKDIFNDFPDLGIEIIKFDEVIYLKTQDRYLFINEINRFESNTIEKISGTLVRQYLKKFKQPPDWLMDQTISSYLLESLYNGEELFIT